MLDLVDEVEMPSCCFCASQNQRGIGDKEPNLPIIRTTG